VHFYLKSIPAEFHPDPIWNDEALGPTGFLKRQPQQQEEEQEQEQDE